MATKEERKRAAELIRENIKLVHDRKLVDLFYTSTNPNVIGQIGELLYQGTPQFLNYMYKIPTCAFQYSSIERITLPKITYQIDSYAFANCKNLVQVECLGRIDNIGTACFQDCVSLEKFPRLTGIDFIPSQAFQYCHSLKEITLLPGVETIESSAFDSCTRVTEVVLPPSIREINYWAFRNLTSLKRIVFLGNRSEWESIQRHSHWATGCPEGAVIECIDETFELE